MKKINVCYILFILTIFFVFSDNVFAVPTLKTLEIENGVMDTFESFKFDYDFVVNSDTLNTNIKYTVELENYYITGVGSQTLQVNTKHYISLVDSEGNISIYTINVLRKVPYLESVKIDEIEFDFDKKIFNYDLEVGMEVESLNINVVEESNSIYEIEGALDLHFGINKLVIKVISNESGLTSNYTFKVNRKNVTDFSSKGTTTFKVLESGYYNIELWGAGGGFVDSNYKHLGHGGYTKGKIYLEKDEILYFYVGEQGKSKSRTATFNGGGIGGLGATYGASGGGATDVRLVGGAWNDYESLKSRIMVAGGGGGGTNDVYNTAGAGSFAGGLIGSDGNYYSGHSYVNQNGKGATQTSGGAGGNNHYGVSGVAYAGSFGVGGNNNSNSAAIGAGGGGGGYYGGGAGGGTGSAGMGQGAGGGSSYISGHAGAIAINLDGTPKVSTYSKLEDSIHYSGKSFSDTVMISGSGKSWTTVAGSTVLMPNPNGGTYDSGRGNAGDGYARISFVGQETSGLKSLVFSAGTLSPSFDTDTYEYNLQLTHSDEDFTITAEAVDEWSIVNGTGTFRAVSGDSSYTISVVNYDGTIVDYVVNVNRPLSSYDLLEGIKINGVEYETFDSNIFSYDIELDTGIDNINLEAVKHISGQTISGEGTFAFNENEKTLTLLVKSEDNLHNKLYTLNFTRKRTSELKFIETVVPLYFTSNKYDYTIDIAETMFGLDFNVETYFEDTEVTIVGNKYITEKESLITITSHLAGVDDTIYKIKVIKNPSMEFEEKLDYTGDVQEFVVPESGNYEIELWGASGGIVDNAYKTLSKGAYTKGRIYLKKGQVLYVYVGEQGKINRNASFNGGGTGGIGQGMGNGASGGGATDIRLVKGVTWNETDSLKSRIMVAGGGGGATASVYNNGGEGNYAGGLIGYNGTYYSGHSYVNQNGKGGTQISGGLAGNNHFGASGTTYSGTFGIGGNSNSTSGGRGAGGGGGGYYGGGAGGGTMSGGSGQGGGGGSSFISGHAGAIAINESGSPKVTTYSKIEDSIHYSGLYFTNTLMIDGMGKKWSTKAEGLVPMPNPYGGYYDLGVGNPDNGHVRITLLKPLSNNNFLDSITLDDGDITLDFDTIVENYELNLDETHLTLKVDAVAKDNNATVSGLEIVKLPPGETIHEISVTAEDGSVRIYSLKINREPSNNPNPRSIEIKNVYDYLCNLNVNYCDYEFNKDVTEYDINYPYDTDSVTFVVNKLSEYQGAKIYKDNLDTQIEDFKVDLKPGVNTFLIETISEDNQSKIFTYNLNRDITGNNLLESLKIINPVIDFEFKKYTYEYYVTVPKDKDAIEIEAIPEDKDSSVTVDIKGNTNLKPGMNDCIITVTAQNGDTRTYIIHAYKEVNRSTLLTDLKVKNQEEILELEPTFNPYLNNYTLNVDNSVSEVNISVIKEDASATVLNDGIKSLNTGVNEIDVIVTSLSGDINTYKLIINRAKSNNAYLKKLEVKNYALNVAFDKETLEYEINIDRDVTSLEVSAETEDLNATYTIRGNHNLNKTLNEIIITVTAENKEYKVYKIKAYKSMNDNNDLISLKVMNGEEELSLMPQFDKDTLEYNVSVGGEVTNVDVLATLEDENASIQGVGKHYLSVGDNEINVTVTSESGQIKTYKIIINKALNDDLTLKRVENNIGSEVIKAIDTTLGYDYLINVQYEVNLIDITGVANANTSKVQGNGTYTLKTGNNDVILTVLSEAGNTKDYVVRVVRDKSDNDDLDFLFVEEGGLAPHFSETVIFYDVKVPNNTNILHIEAITEDSNATYEVVGGIKVDDNYYTYDISSLAVDEPQLVEVVVTAENGVDKKTYTLSVVKQQAETENLALEELTTNRGELIFNPDTLNYELVVEHDISDITISARAFSEDVEVVGLGTYNLIVGKNGIAVFVIGESGVQRDYQIVVTRKKSNDATLASLVVKGSTLNPKFSSNVETYTLKTSASSLDFTTIKPTEAEATYEIIGNRDFVTGENTVTIRVTAPDKETTKNYTLIVTKEASKNNNLIFLRVVDYELKPVFHKGVIFYAIEVDNNLNSIVIEAQSEETSATIKGLGRQVVKTGENYFDVEVTSEAGTVKTYTILVTKEASDNNYLAELNASEGVISPSFDKLENEYTINVANNIDSIDFSGRAEDANAVVTGFKTYNLSVGENIINIGVISESGKINTYVIKVIRESIASPYLINLEVKNYALNPEFDKEIFEYYINVNNEVTVLELSYVKEDENAQVTVSGNEDFVVGMNEVHILVKASNDAEQEYIIYVNRQMSTNNFLRTLSTDKGVLAPEFNPNTLEYNVEVESDVDIIKVFATTMDSSATIISKIGEDNPYTLEKGLNKILVKVKSSIGITRTYTLNVNRKMSNNNNLLNIEVYAGDTRELQTIDFNKEVLDYEINLVSPVDYVDVVVTKEDSLAIVSGDGIVLLGSGENNLNIIVTSEDGTIKTYNLKINNPLSNNANLSGLVPSVGVLTPKFDKDVLNYTLDLDSEVNTLSFDVKTESSKASVSGYEIKGVDEGTSVRNIVVTAEDGTVKTYTITVNKPHTSNALLESLEVEGYPFEFDSNTFSYTIRTSVSKKKLLESEIIAIPKDLDATVNMMGDLELVAGIVNIYTIEVIAKDSYTTQEYTLNIIPDETSEYSLKSEVYEINRNSGEDYVIGIMPSTKIEDFKLNFENEQELLHVYKSEVEQTSGLTATAYVIKLEKEGYTYDTLRVIVRGDLTNDGMVNVTDQVKLINYVGKVGLLDKYQMLAADLTFDSRVNVTDQVKLINYVGKVITNQDLNPKREEEGS